MEQSSEGHPILNSLYICLFHFSEKEKGDSPENGLSPFSV